MIMPVHVFGIIYICICNTKPYAVAYICICNAKPYVTIYIYVTLYVMCDIFLSSCSTSVIRDGRLKDKKAYLCSRDFWGTGENTPFVKRIKI